jgi:acyl carrier protein
MTDYMTDRILRALGDIAPDADLSRLDHHADLREQVELDSMDYLNLMAALAELTGVEVPERDYPKVTTLVDLADYLSARVTT